MVVQVARVTNGARATLSRALGPELRVHGVGGPQGAKMLGALDETDTVTLPQIKVGGLDLPYDGRTRFVRRLARDDVDAYEWGGMTTGTRASALWVLYLPLTVLNATGWSSPSHRRTPRVMTHVLAGLATVTYVLWVAFILLDLIGRQWRQHLLAAGLTAWPVRVVVAPAANVALVVLLSLLFFLNARTAKEFEGYQVNDSTSWKEHDHVGDPGFFAHETSYQLLRNIHGAIALATTVGAIAVARMATGGRTGLGLVLVLLGTTQVVILGVWWLVALVTRDGRQVAAATLGTVLIHALFTGFALLAVDRLQKLPKAPAVTFKVGPELGVNHALLVALVVSVAVVVLGALALQLSTVADATKLPVKLVRRAGALGTALGLTFVVATLWFFAGQIGPIHDAVVAHGVWPGIVAWHDSYQTTQNAGEKLGTLILTALPLLFVKMMWKPGDPGGGRIIANVWDVLTFWPRRFHPFAVPPYAERAVPELRLAIRARRSPDRPVVLAGHSQGSVLAVAAVTAELADTSVTSTPGIPGTVSLVTFGSPIGGLHATFFPAHFGQPQRAALAARIAANGGCWRNFLRATDPIGSRVAGGVGTSQWSDVVLADPIPSGAGDDDDVHDLAPLERPRPWYAVNGHNFYLADPLVRKAIDDLRA